MNNFFDINFDINVFLFDIKGDTKLLFGHKNTEQKHLDVYGNSCELLWKIENVDVGLHKLINLPGENPYSFYEYIETLNINDFKQNLIDLNSSLIIFNKQISTFNNNYVHKDVKKNVKQNVKQNVNQDVKHNVKQNVNQDVKHNVLIFKQKYINNQNVIDGIKYSEENVSKNENICFNIKNSDDIFINNLLHNENYNKLYIYFNNHFNEVHINSDKIDLLYFPELEIICEIKGNEESLTSLRTKINEINFIHIKQVQNFIDFYTIQQTEDTLEKEIEKFITENYNLTSDIEDKIQFTNLYNIIVKNFEKEHHILIKNLLPKILKHLKLYKKRFGQGMFWFGLKLKSKNVIKVENKKITTNDMESLLTELIKDRKTHLPKISTESADIFMKDLIKGRETNLPKITTKSANML